MQKSLYSIEIEKDLYQLLKRCAAIEGREVAEIANSLLRPYLKKYSLNSLEEWEQIREMKEMEKVVVNFQKNEGFDPNHIPFDTQIIGLRRKLDDLDREIKNTPGSHRKLKELRYSLLEKLNFAETEALKKNREKWEEQSSLWKLACEEIPLE